MTFPDPLPVSAVVAITGTLALGIIVAAALLLSEVS